MKMITALSFRLPIPRKKYDSSVVFALKFICHLTYIWNKEFIRGDGNFFHTGSQHGLMNIVRYVSCGLTDFHKQLFIGLNGGGHK